MKKKENVMKRTSKTAPATTTTFRPAPIGVTTARTGILIVIEGPGTPTRVFGMRPETK